MKIAVISHAYQDERYLTTLDAMARHPEIEITLIHPEIYRGERFRWNDSHPIAHIPVPVIFGSRQGTFLYRGGALEKALDEAQPDLILHEQEIYALGAGQIAWVAKRRSIPLVQFVWENVDRTFGPPRRLLRRYVLARTSAMIAGSDGAKQVHAQWGFAGPIEVVPQMSVDTERPPRFIQHGSQTFKVCFVGRLVPCKGVDCLLRAIVELHRDGFRIECAIAGEGPERRRLARLARELGIWALVHFRGRLSGDGVRRLLRSSDVLVLPSRRTETWEEQFGLVLAEAMAEATVTVGSRTGAIPEVIGMEELLFDEDDVQGMARVLQHLARDAGFFLWSQVHLWQQVRERFGTDGVAAQKVRYLSGVRDRAQASAPGLAIESREAKRNENPSFAQSV